MQFEYKVVPAPTRGLKAKGLKTPTSRFAHALTEAINEMAGEGWEYLRAEALPAEERSGLTGRISVQHNLLVFRRAVDAGAEDVAPKLETEVAETGFAPKLPSADAAQDLPDTETTPLFATERDEAAAE